MGAQKTAGICGDWETYDCPMPSKNPPSASFDAQLAAIDQAAHASAFGFGKQRPSDAACNAGNYKVGRVQWQGLNLCIEQPQGSVREKCSKTTGRKWRNVMGAHYGYLQGTKGADGDAVDCFIGAQVDSDAVYVINQGFQGRFDEHKAMLCFGSEEAARAAYMASYELGWEGLQSIVPMTLDQFRWWLKYASLDRPADPQHLPYNPKESPAMKPTAWNGEALPIGGNLDQLIYDIRRDDGAGGLLLDSASMADILSDPDNESVLALDALVTPFVKLEQRMGLLRAAMDRVTNVAVKTQAMQVSDPFKQRGTAQVAVVYELSDGQTISVYLHNPDADPSKINPDDELISWKWMLNKKDVTIVVAPELGKDLNVREVARRMMRLADKNSAAFQRANGKRAERLQAIETLKGEVQGLEAELSAAQKDLELAKLELEEHQIAQIEAAKNKSKNLGMTRSEWEAKVMTALKNRVKSDPYAWIGGGEMDDRNLTGVVEAQWVAQAEPAEAAKVLQEAGKQWDADKAKAMEEAAKAEADAEAARQEEEEQQSASKAKNWWDAPSASKYAAVYLIGKSRSSEYVTLEAKGGDYEAKATQSGIQQSKTGNAQDIYDWLASQVLTGMGHAMQGKSLTAEEMTAKLKLVKGADVLAVAKPAKVKAVTKKEAREAYESLEWCLNHRLEYGNASLAKLANVGEGEILGYLQACEDLIARGLPEMPSHMNMQKLVDRVRAIMEKVKVAKARASGDFGQLGELIEGVAKELQELGWKLTQDGKPNTNPEEETEGGQWAVESPRGTEIVMSPDSRMLDEIDFNGSFDYIARVGDDPAEVAKGIDTKDWAENSDDAPSSDDGIVDDEDSEFFGKSLEFVRANLDLEKAAAAAGATLVWGDFTASLHTGSLFDAATHFGVSAQIGKDGQIAARASISEGGFVTLYPGAAGDAVALESGKYKDIAAKVAELVAAMPAPQSEPAPQPEPQPLPEPEKPADTPVARMNALLKAKPKGEIRSDDPDAIAKLQAKLAYLEGYSELMRNANKLVRKNDRAGLAAMGWSESTIENLFKKDFAGRIGFPDYELKNTNAEARRTKQRLEGLQKDAERAAMPDWQQGKTHQELASMRDMYLDMLESNPNIASADELKSRIAAINGAIGEKQVEKSKSVERAIAKADEPGYMQKLYDLDFDFKKAGGFLSAAEKGVMKNRLRAIAKTIPLDDDKAVSMAGIIEARIFGADYDPRVKSVEFAPAAKSTGTEYRYALVYRPAGMGATPADGFLRVDPAPADIASVARHGVAVYSRELTEQELKQFELRRVHTESERAAAVEAIAQHFADHKYAANYYEYVQEGDMGMLQSVMQQEINKQYPFSAFSDAESMPKEAGERFATLMKAKQAAANDGRITVDGYTYTMDTSDGFMVTFEAPETVRGLKLWAREEDAINAKIQDAIDLAKSSPHLAKRWNSKRGAVTHIAISDMPRDGEGSEYYAVVYNGGEAVVKVRGNQIDETMRKEAYEATPEGAAAIAAERAQRDAAAAEAQARREAAEKAAAARKQDLDSQIDDWLSKTSYTPVQKGSARAILSREAIYPEFDNAQLARVEFVQRVVDKGGKPDVEQVNRIKDKTRTQFNRMSQREQDEHERKIREGGKVAEYSVGNYIVTKTEYDYANYLLGKKTAQQELAASANPERTKAVQYLQGIVSGTTDPLTVDFDNLEALHDAHGSDPEVAALFEKAADVVANAALAATA